MFISVLMRLAFMMFVFVLVVRRMVLDLRFIFMCIWLLILLVVGVCVRILVVCRRFCLRCRRLMS